MPSPDPDVLAAEDGSPPDDLLYLLYRTGEPRDLGATVREWHDLDADGDPGRTGRLRRWRHPPAMC